MEEEGGRVKPEPLRIRSGVEIRVGQVVPIFEHSQCGGVLGTIKEVNPKTQSYKATCDSCGSNVFVDVKFLSVR